MLERYLKPGDVKTPRTVLTFFVVWVLACAALLAAWFIAAAYGPFAALPVLIVLFVAVIVVRVRVAVRPGVLRDMQAAQLERLREHVPEAIAICRRLLGLGLQPIYRAQVLLMLGECAEMEGDFAAEAELCVRAEGTLRGARMGAMLRAQQLAVVAARRAFAHAACGELDRAEATLRTAGAKDGVPLAGALSSRAMLLVLARRGLREQVRERLAADGKLLRNALAFRDRTLVSVLGAYAMSRPVALTSIDASVRPWIQAAFPEGTS